MENDCSSNIKNYFIIKQVLKWLVFINIRIIGLKNFNLNIFYQHLIIDLPIKFVNLAFSLNESNRVNKKGQ